MAERPLSALFYAIVKWSGAERIDLLPGCFEREFTFEGMPVLVSINGHGEDKPSREGMSVPPIHALLMINGWPACLINPYDGTIMAGEPDVEDRLIAAFEADTPAPELPADVERGE